MTPPDRIEALTGSSNPHKRVLYNVADSLVLLSCVDGLCTLILAIEKKNSGRPTPGMENLAEKLAELMEAAKYADER